MNKKGKTMWSVFISHENGAQGLVSGKKQEIIDDLESLVAQIHADNEYSAEAKKADEDAITKDKMRNDYHHEFADSTWFTVSEQVAPEKNNRATHRANEDEIAVPILNGKQFLIFPSREANPTGVNYVRFVDNTGKELLYYDIQEWIEDPEIVMGAIMAAIQNGASVTLLKKKS